MPVKVTSKVGNARLLSHNKQISKHIPKTHYLTSMNLVNMLKNTPSIYIKPNDSCRGKGILRVDQIHANEYILRSRDTNQTFIHKNLQDLWINVHQLRRNRRYVIQQGIQSITKSGKHFDIRVHMTRVNGKWVVAGMIGNIARRGGIITTESSGGVSTYVHELLQNHLGFSQLRTQETIEKLKTISLHATKTTSRMYPRWSEFGLDIGIDSRNNIWIFEINITPGALVFQKLDQKTFQRILYLRRLAQ